MNHDQNSEGNAEGNGSPNIRLTGQSVSTQPTPDDVLTVAIIGGGCSGLLCAIQLLQQFTLRQIAGSESNLAPSQQRRLTLHIIESNPPVGRGIAYGTQCSGHLLNVPACSMSYCPDDPGHFVAWLSKHHPEFGPDSFVPRSIFGHYLQSVFQAELEKLNPLQVEVQTISATAIDLVETASQIEVFLEDETKVLADRVVLALGNLTPGDQFSKLLSQPTKRFHNNPWDRSIVNDVRTEDTVVLIGSGLTMIDIVVQLQEHHHTGTIIAISRRGLLPGVHQRGSSLAALPPPVCQSATTMLAQLRAFTLEEGSEGSICNVVPDGKPGRLRQIFRLIRKTATESGNWRLVFDLLRTETHKLWKCLSKEDRKRFLRHVRPFWEVHRHRMAPEIAAIMQIKQDERRLSILPGRIAFLQVDGELINVHIQPRHENRTSVVSAAVVINCTGPDTNLRHTSHRLIAQMREAGTIVADPLGLGMLTGDLGEVVNNDGLHSTRIYAIGALRKGSLWESTAVPEIREQAAQVAKAILATRQQDAEGNLARTMQRLMSLK